MNTIDRPGRARLFHLARNAAVTAVVATLASLAMTIPAGAVDFPPSSTCDAGTQVIDNTLEGLHTKVYTERFGGEVDLCVRVEQVPNGTGFGGDLVINPANVPGVVVGPVSPPFIDTFTDACAIAGGNQIPGSHPISSGGIAGIPYLIDAYFNDSNLLNGTDVWLCLHVGTVFERLFIPVAVPTLTVTPGSLVEFFADPATP